MDKLSNVANTLSLIGTLKNKSEEQYNIIRNEKNRLQQLVNESVAFKVELHATQNTIAEVNKVCFY